MEICTIGIIACEYLSEQLEEEAFNKVLTLSEPLFLHP